MVEFSSFEKQSEYDADTNACLVKLWYQKDDETEVLIRLLGFGPVVRVLGPARFVRQLRERIDKQMAYLSAGEPQCKVKNSKQGRMGVGLPRPSGLAMCRCSLCLYTA